MFSYKGQYENKRKLTVNTNENIHRIITKMLLNYIVYQRPISRHMLWWKILSQGTLNTHDPVQCCCYSSRCRLYSPGGTLKNLVSVTEFLKNTLWFIYIPSESLLFGRPGLECQSQQTLRAYNFAKLWLVLAFSTSFERFNIFLFI